VLTPTRRLWLYRVLTGGLAVMAGFDIVADTAVPLWAPLIAAVLGTSVAAKHTPRTNGVTVEFLDDKPAGS
jgi:hypothetical protein